MTQYINKSAVVAEIERLIKNSEMYTKHHRDKNDKSRYAFEQQRLVMCELLSFLNTLEVKEVGVDFGDPKMDKSAKCIIDTKNIEVKEVDLDIEIIRYRMRNPIIQHREKSLYDYMANAAKHFFELGMSVRNKPHKGE